MGSPSVCSREDANGEGVTCSDAHSPSRKSNDISIESSEDPGQVQRKPWPKEEAAAPSPSLTPNLVLPYFGCFKKSWQLALLGDSFAVTESQQPVFF